MEPPTTTGPPGLANLSYSADSIQWPRELPSGGIVNLELRDLRRERTGMHGLVAITSNGTVLAHDTYNLGRSEERRRLARRAHPDLGLLGQEYTVEALNHDLDMVCLWACNGWEAARFVVERVDPAEAIEPLNVLLEPYIVDGGGTILFAAPGSGKSFLALLMAASLANGLRQIWNSAPTPVLYVNLERSRRSLMHRDMQLRRVLGLVDTGIDYLHAAGRSYRQVHSTVKRHVQDNPGTVVFLDSISRAGLGSLNEDQAANAFVDSMNSLETAWLGIGHTPKHNPDTLFGSMHFEAGEDIGIKVTSDLKDNVRGIAMQVVKANDIQIPPVRYLALEFDQEGLARVRNTTTSEFPALAGEDKPMTDHETLQAVLRDGAMSVAELAKASGKPEGQVRVTINRHTQDYVRLPGTLAMWGLRVEGQA